MSASPVGMMYETTIDRDSAYEVLLKRTQEATVAVEESQPEPVPRERSRQTDTFMEAATKSLVRSASSQLGRQIVRGILGSIFKRR